MLYPDKLTKLVCVGVLVIFGTAGAGLGDTIILKKGQKLTGEILAEKDNRLIVDIGIDVLSIAKEDIKDFQYQKETSAGQATALPDEPNEPNEPTEKTGQETGKLYYTIDREKMSIEECVDQVEQSVVKVSTPAGMGSGFFLNEKGQLITNYHVIEKETRIEVTLFQKGKDGFEKKKFDKVRIQAINPFIDLALLKVEDLGDTEIRYAYLGDKDEVKVGNQVFAIGNPLGLERTVTDGVISTTNRSFEGLVYIQTNADINPGNSGGPLFNLRGEVIGITNMGYIFFGGLGFAIPIDYVKHFLDNYDAFSYDEDNPNTGYRYIQPDSRRIHEKPDFLKPDKTNKDNKNGKVEK